MIPSSPDPGFLTGVNYPWIRTAEGVQNYGADFGATRSGTHAGVEVHAAAVRSQFAAIAAMGMRVVRWFVFCDGRGGIRFDERGMPLGLAEGFLQDLDAALELAREQGLLLDLVLLDFLWLRDEKIEGNLPPRLRRRLVATAEGRKALVQRVFVPAFRRSAGHPALFAWEVMNEPEFVIREMDGPFHRAPHGVRLRDFRLFCAAVGSAVHGEARSRFTLGTTRVRYLPIWQSEELQIDFLQLHPYADFLASKEDRGIYGRACVQLGLRKPLVVGEFPARGYDTTAPGTAQYLEFLLRGGYAGGWIWSYNAGDPYSGVDPEPLRLWAAANTRRIATPGSALAFAPPPPASGGAFTIEGATPCDASSLS